MSDMTFLSNFHFFHICKTGFWQFLKYLALDHYKTSTCTVEGARVKDYGKSKYEKLKVLEKVLIELLCATFPYYQNCIYGN
jgi:succinylglutamate desuccinylase